MPRLLIVDDEPFVRRSLQKTLLRQGFAVETAEDCASGLHTFETAESSPQPFDLAILDLNMPGFDGRSAENAGLQLLERLHQARSDLPVVVLTAYDEAGKAKKAIQKGAADYWVKGRETGLVDLIQGVLKANERQERS
jgi:CheY-like chemotaxis protein